MWGNKQKQHNLDASVHVNTVIEKKMEQHLSKNDLISALSLPTLEEQGSF